MCMCVPMRACTCVSVCMSNTAVLCCVCSALIVPSGEPVPVQPSRSLMADKQAKGTIKAN